MARLTTAIVLVMVAAACGKPAPVDPADPYLTEIAKFREAREAVLKTDTGWLTIAGLFFLAVAITCAVYVITDFLFHRTWASLFTALVGAAFLVLWYGLPLAAAIQDSRRGSRRAR